MPLFSPSKDYTTSASSYYHPSTQHSTHSHSHSHHHSSSSHPASFFFRRRTGKLNWSHLSSVSLASIIQHVDVDALQQHVDTITYADITDTDLSHATDPQILHLIRLMQLTIEYLINAQNFLIKQAKRRDRLMTEVTAEVERCKQQLQLKDDEIARLKQDNKYHKRLLKAYETANLSPNKGGGGGLPITAAAVHLAGGGGGGAELSVYTCEYCRASFVSEVYLQGHIGRRHPDAKTRRPTGSGMGKGRDGMEEDDERERAREREKDKEKETEKRVRERIEEEERGKRELQRMRDELEADRRRMKEEMEKEKAELAKAAEREREAQQAEWQQQRKKQQQREEEEQKEQFDSNSSSRQPHHTNSRPAPILVTAPQPQPQPQPAALAVEMERVAAEMQQLKDWKDGVMRGDIVISPQPHSANTQPANSQHNQRPPQQSTPTLSLSPSSPVPSPSASSSSSRQQHRQQQPRLTSSHRLKRFSSFSTFPQLLSHFQHNENDLVRAADGLEAAMDGWTEADAERKEEELARVAAGNGGWERDVAGVEGEVDRLMDGFVNEALEERWAAVMEKERELETRKKQREDRARERETATRRATERLAAERQAMEYVEADRRQRGVIDAVEREREMQRVEHERQLMAAQQAQLMAAEQMAAHQQLLAHQAAQLSMYSQPAPLQPMLHAQSQPQQSSMDEQRFLLDKQNALRTAQQLPTTTTTANATTTAPYNQQQQQSAALARAAAAVATQRRGALPPSYNGVEEISDLDSEDNSPLPQHQPKQRMEEHKQPTTSSGHLLSPPQQRAAFDVDDDVESISLSQPVSPIPHIDDSVNDQQQQQQPQQQPAHSPSRQQQPVQLGAVRRVGGGFMLPAVAAKSLPGGSTTGGLFESGPRVSALKPIDQTRAVVRDLSAELDLDEEEF